MDMTIIDNEYNFFTLYVHFNLIPLTLVFMYYLDMEWDTLSLNLQKLASVS